MESINQRIAHFIDSLQLNPNRFAKRVGYKRPDNIYNVYTGKTKPSWEMLDAIARTYPNLNMNWLIGGRGAMLLEDEASTPSTKLKNQPSSTHSSARLGKQIAVTVDALGNDTILYVPLTAQESYRRRLEEHDFLGSPQAFTLPGFTEGDYRAFQVEGDSMRPAVQHGDYVICSRVENPRQLRPGQAYLIVTADEMLLRRVGLSKASEVELLADNVYYPPYWQSLEQIIEVWLVKGVLSMHLPAGRQGELDRLLAVVEALGKNTLLTQQLLAALSRQS